MHRPILKHLFPTLALLAAVVSASAALVDTDGNPANNDTYLGDIDMAASTYGDLKNGVSPGYGTVSNAAVNAAITNALQDAALAGKVPTSRKVNGKALSADVTLTGADIAVSGSDATKINAALAGKATKADTTLAERGFAEWVCNPSTVLFNGTTYPAVVYRFAPGPGSAYWAVGSDAGGSPYATQPYDETATSLTFSLEDGFEPRTVVATRTALSGYILGPDRQTNPNRDKPLASEAEAEALRTAVASKQYKLPYPTNAIPYAAISGTPTNVSAFNNDAGYITSESDPVWESEKIEILDQLDAATETNALQTAQMASLFNVNTYYIVGQIVIRNGILYRCIITHTGAWNPAHFTETSLGNEVSDISASVSNKLDASNVVPLGDGASTGQAADAASTSHAVAVIDSNVYYLQQDVSGMQVSVSNLTDDVKTKLESDATGAAEWTVSHGGFAVGDKVWFDGLLYEATEVVPASDKTTPPNNSKFKAVYIFDEIAEVADNVSTGKVSTAAVDGWYQDFSPTQQYYADSDTVGYKGVLYKCTVNHLGDWDETHFVRLPILTRANVQPVTGSYPYDYEPASAGDTYRALQSLSGDIAASSQAATNHTDTSVSAAATASTNYTDTVAEELSRRLDDPKNYVISPLANYYYSGSSSIPAGNYFRAITGEGYSRYAAIIPVPHGKVVMSGDSEDPIISYFGNELEVDTDKLTIISVSSNDTEGKYNVSDVKFISDSSLGMIATFHCNILNPASELTEIGFSTSPGSMTFTIGDEQHTCTVATQSSTGFTYTDSIYNLSDGTWTSASYTITVAFNPSSTTDWGWGIFGGVELAVKGDPGTVRVLGLRTGLPGEYGSGWGYKTYNFSSDRRNWEINVPNMQASCNKSSATTTKYFVTTGGAVTNDFQCYVSPLSQSEHCITIATLEETADAYGEDACAQGTWRVSMFPTITNRTDACALSVIATNRVQVGIIGVNETQESVVPASFTVIYHGQKWTSTGYRSYTATHTISNFRITAITGSGATRTISFSYDVAAVVGYSGRTYYAYYTASQIVTLTSGLDIDSTVTKPSTLIVTDRNQHLFYDEGLQCTWELCVTNGVFYTRKVSNGDYRKEDE